MKVTARVSAVVALTLLGLAALPAHSVLAVGDVAPDFTAEAALDGKSFRFVLSESLKKGPVVLYFYPKAFTSGCTVEAHNFAEATPTFTAMGATVIGMSNDDIATLKKFSVEACRSKFAVAADNGARIMKRYDAALRIAPDTADRVSYVIGPQGRVLYTYSSLSPDGHVENTLKAVEKWKAGTAAR